VNVAVTGGTGFVGRHVVARLESLGVSPTIVVRPGSPAPDALLDRRIVRMDVLAPPVAPWDLLGRPDVLIHLAWGGLPNYRSPHHLEQELPAHGDFLERLVQSGLGAVTVSGTCLEYGLQSGALREDLPTAPVTAYGQAKDALRRRLEALRRTMPFDFTWARLFYLYGPGQAPGSLLPQLEQAIDRGDEAFPLSGGEQLRDYLPVGEAASLIVALALNGRDNGIVNVCSGRPITVRALVERAAARLGSSIQLDFGRYPYLDYEPMAFWGDRSKLDRCLAVPA
jgi:dTDP-6-deoxy-L-talose 4-dehydrogenase (NAD+)